MAPPFMNPANFPFMPNQPPNMSAAQVAVYLPVNAFQGHRTRSYASSAAPSAPSADTADNAFTAQGQSMANGFLAQQHLAAAFALGAVPFGLNPNGGPPPHFPGFFPGFPPMTQPHAHGGDAGATMVKEDPAKTDGLGMLEGSFQQLSGGDGQEAHDGGNRTNLEGLVPRHIIQDGDATESSSQVSPCAPVLDLVSLSSTKHCSWQ